MVIINRTVAIIESLLQLLLLHLLLCCNCQCFCHCLCRFFCSCRCSHNSATSRADLPRCHFLMPFAPLLNDLNDLPFADRSQQGGWATPSPHPSRCTYPQEVSFGSFIGSKGSTTYCYPGKGVVTACHGIRPWKGPECWSKEI